MEYKVYDPMNLDAGESAFFDRELKHVKARSYDVKYKELKYTTLLPISFEVHPGAREVTYQKYSKIGFAKVIADYANDFPRADVYGEEVTQKVRSIGNSFGYSIQEIRESQMAGKNLDQRRADSARRAQEEKHNDIAWNGDSLYGLVGFISFPGITEYTLPDGAGGTTDWASKTPDEIIADMSGIVSGVIDSTNGREVPDTMIMPIDQYNLIANTRMTGASNRTILKFFLENNPYIKTVDWLVELKDAGSADDSNDRLMVYKRDPMNVTYEMPQTIEQFAPQQKGLEFIVPLHSRSAGVIVYYPLSVSYADGI
jgi:hypothetical protein